MTKLRGAGGIYLRGSVWWIRYSRNGHLIRESSESTDDRAARKLLQKRLEEKNKPTFVGPNEKKLTLDDREAAIRADYVRHERRSWETVEHCLKPVKDYFKYDTLLQIGARIEKYQDQRLKLKMARATINRECAYLRRGFKLLYDARRLSQLPVIKMLEGENVREGFLNRPEFEAICTHLKPDVNDIVRFLYNCSWRSGEAKTLEWSKFDSSDWIFRLSRKNSKSKRPRTLVLVGELREIIERRLAKRLPECPYVFHRNGKPIRDFRKAFKAAAKEEGLEGLVLHDMRRSGIRNFTKAGVGESEGMAISGHETNSVYKRYNIVDEEMQRRTLERVHEQQQREKEARKVVPIRQAG